jgi:hypothetical protein
VLVVAVQVSFGTVKVTVPEANAGGVVTRYPAKLLLGELAPAGLTNPNTTMPVATSVTKIIRRIM